MERRLRSTAVDPGVRYEHFDALRAELQSRMRTHRHRPLFVAAVSIVFMCMVTFQDQPLESYNYRLGYFAGERDTVYSYKPHKDASTSWAFSRMTEAGLVPMTSEEVALQARKAELSQAMFDAGYLEPAYMGGHTWRGQTTYEVEYTGEAEGLDLSYPVYIDEIDHPDHHDFMVNRYFELYMAAIRGELTEYASQIHMVEDQEFVLHGWRYEDPVYGEVIIWTTRDFN